MSLEIPPNPALSLPADTVMEPRAETLRDVLMEIQALRSEVRTLLKQVDRYGHAYEVADAFLEDCGVASHHKPGSGRTPANWYGGIPAIRSAVELYWVRTGELKLPSPIAVFPSPCKRREHYEAWLAAHPDVASLVRARTAEEHAAIKDARADAYREAYEAERERLLTGRGGSA